MAPPAPDLQYRVAREKGTGTPSPANTGTPGDQGACNRRCCGAPLFRLRAQVRRRLRLAEFGPPPSRDNVETAVDRSHFMVRTEVPASAAVPTWATPEDGPQPTGLRYRNQLGVDCLVGTEGTQAEGCGSSVLTRGPLHLRAGLR